MTPADEIDAAALKLEKLIAGTTGNNRPWRFTPSVPQDSVRSSAGWEIAYGDDERNLQYIAAVGPVAGVHVAAWLRTEATRLRKNTHPSWQDHVSPHALGLAREINGAIE